MSLDKVPDAFADQVEEDEETGCWVWFNPPNPKSKVKSPVYSRRAAWKFAYEQLYGPLPKGGQFPTISGCVGSECVNPDHRLGLPRDQRNTRHRCSVCKKWHDPEEEEYQPEATAKPVSATRPPIRKFSLRDVVGFPSNLTPEQQELEDMMDDSDLGLEPGRSEET